MLPIEKVLMMIRSNNPDARFRACEELRLAESIPKEALAALEEATQDSHPKVAHAARRALAMNARGSPQSQRPTTPSAADVSSAAAESAGPTGVRPQARIKNPWLTILLNAFPVVMGLGYVYLGRWLRFAAVVGIQLFGEAFMGALGLGVYSPYLLLALWIGTLFDGYFQARAHNARVSPGLPHAIATRVAYPFPSLPAMFGGLGALVGMLVVVGLLNRDGDLDELFFADPTTPVLCLLMPSAFVGILLGILLGPFAVRLLAGQARAERALTRKWNPLTIGSSFAAGLTGGVVVAYCVVLAAAS